MSNLVLSLLWFSSQILPTFCWFRRRQRFSTVAHSLMERIISRANPLCCYSGRWNAITPAAAVFLALYAIGIPAAFLYILMRYRRSPQGFQSADFIARYSALTLPYISSRWWYELVNIARRASLILSIDLLASTDNVFIQANFVVFFIVTFLIITLFIRTISAHCPS